MLSRPFAGAWSDLVVLGQNLIESEQLEQLAADACRRFVDQTRHAMTAVRASFLSEDYLVFAVTSLDEPFIADQVIARHGGDIAQLLRGERQPLSQQEQDEVLRHRLSYFAADVVVPAWNAAFVLDTEAAALATVEILELANSQLLEFRFYDDLLESELGGIYAELQRSKWTDRMAWRRHSKATRRVQSIVIDVNELTDRMEHTVDFIGEQYAAVCSTWPAPGSGSTCGRARRRGKAEDAGRHPPVCGRTDRRCPSQHHGDGRGADPHRRPVSRPGSSHRRRCLEGPRGDAETGQGA